MAPSFPDISRPLVINAPMDTAANAVLASEVTKAGGLGFIQGGDDFSPSSPRINQLADELSRARTLLPHLPTGSPLPIGVGFITSCVDVANFKEYFLPIIVEHQPVAIWLFAPTDPQAHAMLTPMLQQAGAAWGLRVIAQVGSVASAREAVREGVDIIVAQGIDAGGHQWAQGAGIISLLPEVVDAVHEEMRSISSTTSARDVKVWAAGGIADGRGAAACILLGADGIVLGSRFLVAHESTAKDFQKQAVLRAEDGGSATLKSKLHDHLLDDTIWGDKYDCRAVVTASAHDFRSGVEMEVNRALLQQAESSLDFTRSVTCCGTAAGLIKKPQPAADIVREVRRDAISLIQRAARAT